MVTDELEFLLSIATKQDYLNTINSYSIEYELEFMFDLNYGYSYAEKKSNDKKIKNKLKRNNKLKLSQYSLESIVIPQKQSKVESLETITRKNMLEESQRRTKAFHANKYK